MKTSPLFGLLICSAISTQAQDVVFSEDFESGQLDGEWFWTGNVPVLVEGYNSEFAVSKESNDLCVPPLADPWNISLLFHPVDFDPTVMYTLTAAIKVNAPFNGSASGEIGLGWLATEGGYGFYYGDAHSSQSDWDQVYLAPLSIGPGFPGARFGVVLHLDLHATDAHGSFDNIKLLTTKSGGIGMEDAEAPYEIAIGPNPMVDELCIAFAMNERARLIELTDAQGHLVLTRQYTGDPFMRLDVSNLNAGVYAVRIVEGDHITVRRVVKN